MLSSLQPSSASSSASKKRKSPFPAQSNNLLSYFQPRARSSVSVPLRTTPQQEHQPFASTRPEPSSQPPTSSPTEHRSEPLSSYWTQTQATESTASKLAKQLRNFHSCTHEDHNKAQELHIQHHQRSDVHSKCSSFKAITQLLRGDYNGGNPLPDMLQNPHFMKAQSLKEDLDCQKLHLDSSYEHTTFLSSDNFKLWYNGVLMPAIQSIVQDANILQHYPVSAEVVALDATALSAETFAKKDTSRAQLLKYALQPQHLDPIWTHIQDSITNNIAYSRFRGATLFVNSKDTKLEYMTQDLSSAYHNWETYWSSITNSNFYSKDCTFVDLGKQITSEESSLPTTSAPSSEQAEVFLWKKCCLESYYRSRVTLLADGKPARGNPKCTVYPFATTRDSTNQTLFAAPGGKERSDGLVYSQFYGLIKTPFDTSKAYVFQQDALENLVLDPSYVCSVQQEGGATIFSEAVCKKAYLHMKQRAHVNLQDNQCRSYGIREEHRISLTMMEEIVSQWKQQDLYSTASSEATERPLPYYIVPTKELFGFLHAQINKYCFLFEHTYAHTFGPVSHPQSAVMLVALRALRFCYSSNILAQESLLYKDRWEKDEEQQKVVVEGFGMQQTIEQCGLGWFLPKFNWATLRIKPPHGENMLRGCLLNHPEYKRRWQAVKDLQNVFVRFNQAERWLHQYNIRQKPGLLRKWLEYLYALNLEQFDVDLWKAVLKAKKQAQQLSPQALQQAGKMAYCYDGMKDLAELWLDWFLHLVRLTHWILPSPSDRALIESTKSNREKGLSSKLMWFSAVFSHPELSVQRTEESNPRTLHVLLYKAHRSTGRDGTMSTPWDVFQLTKACTKQGIKILGVDESVEHWRRGRRSIGSKGWLPVWEQGRPPLIEMQERIRGMSLDDLEGLMTGWNQEHSEQIPSAVQETETLSPASNRARENASHNQSNIGRASNRQQSHASSSTGKGTGSVYTPSE
ncbi:hypothetical protein BU25DRAFT_342766 [Macroventuria anomochaeta]|uniref:Uncharacterized protein n=1 Tax=Macroventuria anomochaeta TaxID=301207 RepID=A0ACB6RXN7_9PLEO|nr:uncharacterized protein BU25DRAFT_342766 [Macroventuria anomochaeta]KAF2626745.1 hypothetical protein BU25DRAFT_342766 [Macroventuria anomochaeta]